METRTGSQNEALTERLHTGWQIFQTINKTRTKEFFSPISAALKAMAPCPSPFEPLETNQTKKSLMIPPELRIKIMQKSMSRNRLKRVSSFSALFLCAIHTDNPGLAFFPSQSLPLSLFSPPKLINTSFKS